jgi:transposase InsO family protein
VRLADFILRDMESILAKWEASAHNMISSNSRRITDDWLRRYNEIRPHDALGSLPPARYRERLLATQNSTLELST